MLVQPKTKGPAFECEDWSPFDACSCLREMQSKYALSSTCQARLTTVNGTIRCSRVPGGPGSGPLKSRVTRWRVRVRPPEFGGYPFVAGTRRVAPLTYTYARCLHDEGDDFIRRFKGSLLIINGPHGPFFFFSRFAEFFAEARTKCGGSYYHVS